MFQALIEGILEVFGLVIEGLSNIPLLIGGLMLLASLCFLEGFITELLLAFDLEGWIVFAVIGAIVGILQAVNEGGGYVVYPLFAAVAFAVAWQFKVPGFIAALLLYGVATRLVRFA